MAKEPRQLTAYGKAATGSANSSPRGGVEVVDRRGFVHVVGSMSTPPQNDAACEDLSPRYEEFDPKTRSWLTSTSVTWTLSRMTPQKRASYLAVRVGLVRLAAGDARGGAGDEAYSCPRGYDADLNRDEMLRKALKCGLLTLSGRTYRLSNPRPDTFAVRHAAGTTNFTREALLDSMARGAL